MNSSEIWYSDQGWIQGNSELSTHLSEDGLRACSRENGFFKVTYTKLVFPCATIHIQRMRGRPLCLLGQWATIFQLTNINSDSFKLTGIYIFI